MTEIRVPVPPSGGAAYRVEVEAGGLARLGERCRDRVGAARYAVVADERVAELYGDPALASLREAGCTAELLAFPEGEGSKRRERWAALTDRMLASDFGRDAAVVALGGGVTGDLAGFVAATYMRGLPVVQVPTSLLAMLDSSVGGKTGVNTRAGKNLVGAFHHPAHVLADPELLATLAPRHRRAGLAEAVKSAAVADAGLLAWIEETAGALASGETAALAQLVRRTVRVKADVVARDPEERGRRAILNFGHTLGHALERIYDYEILHGEAVAAGMVLEARLGQALGVTREGTAERLAALLAGLGLPAPGERRSAGAGRTPGDLPSPAALLAAARTDKKRREGAARFVLLRRVGAVARAEDGAYTHALDDEPALRHLTRAFPRADGGAVSPRVRPGTSGEKTAGPAQGGRPDPAGST